MSTPFKPCTWDVTHIMQECPWNRDWHNDANLLADETGSTWNGKFVDVDVDQELYPATDNIFPSAIDEIIAIDPDEYVALIRLKDGRWIGWESWSDVTGSGFQGDAYGGNLDVWVARSARPIIALISERARDHLVFATHPHDEALVNVLYDVFASDASLSEGVRIATQSGEFGDLVQERVWELWRRWDKERKADAQTL